MALLATAASVPNFNVSRTSLGLRGWTNTSTQAPCAWSRVTCNEQGYVTVLDLSSLGLQGVTQREVASMRRCHGHAPCRSSLRIWHCLQLCASSQH